MSVFFIHGGPGFNSKPEAQLLADEFNKLDEKTFFWNEPSKKRGEPETATFEKTLKDFEFFFTKNAQKKNTIIAHSFGAFTALNLPAKVLSQVQKIILIAPTLDLKKLDQNIVTLAISQLKKINEIQKAKELETELANFTSTYDQHRFNTTLNALVSVDLLSFYWFDKTHMKTYQDIFQGEYLFDIENYQSIRMSINNEALTKKIEIPITIFFGANDQISKQEDMDEIIKNNLRVEQIIQMKESAHYPLIEETQKAFLLLKNELTP